MFIIKASSFINYSDINNKGCNHYVNRRKNMSVLSERIEDIIWSKMKFALDTE